MRRLLLFVVWVTTAAQSWAAPPRLNIPAEVRAVGEYATLAPDTEAVSVVYVGLSGVSAFPGEFLRDRRVFILPTRGLAAGRYQFVAVGASKDGDQAQAAFAVIVGDVPPSPPPGPGPGPAPGPGPTPGPAPIPVAGNRVLIVYETGTVSTLPSAQAAVLTAEAVRSYLNAKCLKRPSDNTPEWRIWDPNLGDVANNIQNETAVWQDVLKRPRKSLPWIVISTGTSGTEQPLPADVPSTLALLKKYFGD